MTQVPQWLLMALILTGVIILGFIYSGPIAGLTTEPAASATSTAAKRPTTAVPSDNLEKIRNAMSAAPFAISQDALIMDWPASPDGSPIELRSGFNGWTCFPDDPSTPGNDPMCADEIFMAMLQAYMAHTPFSTEAVGMAYMLQGGATASNSDPYTTVPATGDHWLMDPPHLMLVGPPSAFAGLSTDPMSGGPYVMWQGTPYAHVMIPTAR